MIEQISQKTAQQIVDTVKDVCGQNINFIDKNGIIYASTNPKRVGKFHEIGKQVILTGNTIEVSSDNSFYGTYQGVNIPISHEGKIFGVIGISGNPDEVRKFAYLAQKITSIILREHDLDSKQNNFRNKMSYALHSILSNDGLTEKFLAEFLSENGIGKEDLFRTILVRLDSRYNPNNIHMIEQWIYNAFEIANSSLYTFNYPNDYVLIISEKKYAGNQYVFKKLADSYENILRIGIGTPYDILGQHRSFNEAEIALSSKDALASYENLDIELILGNVTEEIRVMYTDKILKNLSSDDIALLAVYYNENMSLSHTSERLFIHKNTLQYRLDRIHKKSGYNPRVFHDAVVLYTALNL